MLLFTCYSRKHEMSSIIIVLIAHKLKLQNLFIGLNRPIYNLLNVTYILYKIIYHNIRLLTLFTS